MEKACALNAILVFQILLKVRNKEQDYNRCYAFEVWSATFKDGEIVA